MKFDIIGKLERVLFLKGGKAEKGRKRPKTKKAKKAKKAKKPALIQTFFL
tara:strand:- start:293 stop:442 length:150 start_codon:yes stop_codon:yes gene_type:complete